MTNIQALRGTVFKLERHLVPNAVSFELSGRPVVFISTRDEVPIINQGNELIVAGYLKKGVFCALAYQNLSRKTWGENFTKDLNRIKKLIVFFLLFLLLFVAALLISFIEKIVCLSLLIFLIILVVILVISYVKFVNKTKSVRKAIRFLRESNEE